MFQTFRFGLKEKERWRKPFSAQLLQPLPFPRWSRQGELERILPSTPWANQPTQPSPFKYSLNIPSNPSQPIPSNHNPNKYPIILYGLKIQCQPISSHFHEPWWSYLRYPTIPVLRLRRRSRRSRSIWIQAIIVNQHTITTWLVQVRLCYPLTYGTNHAKPTWF